MALKPTIYKLRIALSDLERNYYDTLNLTVALHPSETSQRMMARVMAYCLNANEGLSFTKGLSEVDEPDIWLKSLDDEIELWIELGEPALDRIKKATRLAERVRVYSFNSKANTWWSQGRSKLSMLEAEYFKFNTEQIEQLTALLQRTMDISITITGDSAYVATADGEVEVTWFELN